MKSKINLPRLAGVVALAFVAVLVFASTSYAQLFPQLIEIATPKISFDSGGVTTYDANTGALSIVGSTIAMQMGPGLPPCFFVVAPETFRISAQVGNSGALVGGVPGDDLVITGGALSPVSPPPFLCNPANMVLSGVLMRGSVQEFGYRESPDQFAFRFSLEGGAFYDLGMREVAVKVSIDTANQSTFTGGFNTGFSGGAIGDAGVPVALMAPPPPTVTTSGNVVVEAAGPGGATATFTASATAFGGPVGALAVMCAPLSGSLFPLGPLGTTVTCTSAPDSFGQVGVGALNVKVQDTTAPILIGGDIEVQATGADGALVPLAVTANDLVDGDGVPVTACSRDSAGSLFAIGSTQVTCEHSDAAGNAALTLTFTVTVKVVPPVVEGEGCFILDFREITYFKGALVIMSSDADIRARNGIAGVFNPSVWPYRASGGSAYTASRGTLFRVYGFQPAELGLEVQDADFSWVKYPVKFDNDTKGYYVDLGGPAKVIICEAQLHEFVLTGKKGNGHKDGSTLLPVPQRNVPGVMLTHNAQVVKVPNRVRWELYQLGLPYPVRGLIDYIGFQLQGNGSATYREFVDVQVLFPGDSATDRRQHFESGFHTATNTNFETFAGCSYLDSAPGNDAVRLRDVWGPNRSRNLGYSSYLACGTKEPAANQKVRANYEVPYNGIQILPTVNSSTDTLRLFYGAINPIPDRERNKKDHRLDWSEWDRWDH